MLAFFFSLLLQAPPGTFPDQEYSDDQGSPQSSPALDSARIELNRDRPWHAAQRLWEAYPQGPGADQELALLFIKAEAGWMNWEGVLTLLDDPYSRDDTARIGHDEPPELLFLLGRALEADGALEEAEDVYGLLLSPDTEGSGDLLLESRVRRARLRGMLGRHEPALEDIIRINQTNPGVGSWVALTIAEMAAAEGAREMSRVALSSVPRDDVRHLGWEILPRALLVAGDSTGAEAAYWTALPSLRDPSQVAAAWERVGALRLARGDTVGARGAFHQVLAASTVGGPGGRAARSLLTLGFDSLGVALAAAGTLAREGDHEGALRAYGEYERLASDPISDDVRLAQVRSHLALRQGRQALDLLSEVTETADPSLAPRALAAKAGALGLLGRRAEVASVQEELIQGFPHSPEAVEILYRRAEALYGRGDRDGAVRAFEDVAISGGGANLAGEARMRAGQLLTDLGRAGEALSVYVAYLEEFPEGRRWDQAAFWAGRLLAESGQEGAAEGLFEELVRRYPLSYYSVLVRELAGQAYSPPISQPADSLPFPTFLREGLSLIDVLLRCGFPDAAEWEAAAMARRLEMDGNPERRQSGLLRLALELADRGLTREGINIGWDLRREGMDWNRHLLRAIYPFPYREILLAEAEEKGVDPFLMAGMIRQESAFWVRARSRADARGLMQVLPTTGEALARSQGPSGFRAEDHLYEAEINIHLGTAFFVDMRRRFGDDLPIILSAYNAGPSRAERWRRFPEAGDLPRFVERIPFSETRGYVKNVTANRAIYTWLYGSEEGLEGNPDPVP